METFGLRNISIKGDQILNIIDLQQMEIIKIEKIIEGKTKGYQILFEGEGKKAILTAKNCELAINEFTTNHGGWFPNGTIDMFFQMSLDQEHVLFTINVLQDTVNLKWAEAKLTELLGYEVKIEKGR